MPIPTLDPFRPNYARHGADSKLRKREFDWITDQRYRRKWKRLNKERWQDVRYTKVWCSDCKTYQYYIKHDEYWNNFLHCECLPF